MIFGELEFGATIGRGGMGEVREAVHPVTGVRYAVKIYGRGDNSDDDFRARFESESRLLASLRHPRIVPVVEFGVMPDGCPYSIMPLVLNPEGKVQTLADVPDGSADEEMIGRWYDDIREGLAVIHARGIVHRDLKLQNVLIGPDGHTVLADFGISHVPAEEAGGLPDTLQTIVRIRAGKRPVMGTVGYMAPELMLGCAATAASDLYALGVCIYRLLTGTWCDARTQMAETLETFDSAWMRIIPYLLHANPEGRKAPSYGECHVRLQEEQTQVIETMCEETQCQLKALQRRVRFIWFPVMLVLLVLAACGVWYGTKSNVAVNRAATHGSARMATPGFADLFRIPVEAKAADETDAEGNVLMPSRSAFEASRVDALVLTEPIFTALHAGSITLEKASAAFEHMAEALDEDAMSPSPLEELVFGGVWYLQLGDNQSLQYLLRHAAEKLRETSDL